VVGKFDENEEAYDALGAWRELPPVLFYNLASRVVLERGIQYFQQKRVYSLSVSKPNRRWKAKVLGNGRYSVTIELEGRAIDHKCNCPAHRDSGACKHVMAVIALLYFLGQEKRFGRGEPDPAYLDQIREGLKRPRPVEKKSRATVHKKAAKSPGKKKAARGPSQSNASISVYPGNDGLPVAEVEGRLPKAKLNALGFDTGWNMYGRPVRHFWEMSMARELAGFAKSALAEGVPVFVKSDHPDQLPITGGIEQVTIGYEINHNLESAQVELIQIMPEFSAKPVIQLGMDTFLIESGGLVEVMDTARSDLVKLADPAYLLDPAGDYLLPYNFDDEDLGNTRDRDEFNAFSLAIPVHRFGDRLTAPPLLADRERIDPDALGAPVPIHGEVSIETSAPGESAMARIWFLAGQTPLSLEGPLLDQLRETLCGKGIDERLSRAKGRLEVLLGAVRSLMLTTDNQERKRLIKAAASDPSFVKLRLKSKAKQWLKAVMDEWIDADEDHLLAGVEGDAPWMLCQSPRPLFIHLMLGLNSPENRAELGRLTPEVTVPKMELPQFIQRTSLVCAAAGVPLKYNRSLVKSVPVSVELEAEATDDIDWFELKAEIRCGELTITEKQWEALIRGELLLEANGELIVPELKQVEAVKRLQTLFGQPKRGKRAVSRDGTVASTPRLQMLDWIELRQQGVQLRLPEEVERVWQNLTQFTEIPTLDIPAGMNATLRDYQQRGFEWMAFLYEHRFGACLADDMGLGKTLQAITFLAWVKARGTSSGPFLIVLPPSLIFNWRSEIERFCPGLKVEEYIGAERCLKAAGEADVILTTYDLVRRDIEALEELKFEVVIFDEVQALKNVKGARTKAALKLRRAFTLCLTGTPMENHAGEYYSIMNLATPGIFGDYADFRRGLREGEDLVLRRARPFMLRRTKDEILKELPSKVESEIFLDMTTEQKEIYTRAVGEVREEVLTAYRDKPRAQAGIVALAALTRLRQVCISPELLGKPIKHPAPKIDYLLGKMRELLDEGHSALFFSQFTRTLDLLQDSAASDDIKVLRLDGSTPTKTRQKQVEAFQNSDKPQMFIISLKAGGAGLNLTRAQYVFHIDPWWNPAVENQASDRAHRIGQKKTVFIQRMLMRHSVEEKIMELKKRKQKLFEAIVGASSSKASGGSAVTRDDFNFLLSSE